MNTTNRYRRSMGAVAAVVTLSVAAVAQNKSPALSPSDKMKINGIGAVRIGMPLTKAIDATQMSWNVEFAVSDGDCRYATPIVEKPNEKTDLSFMVVDGVIVRAEVSKRGIATVSGVRVGDTEAKVKAAYPGKIKSEVHPYDENGHYLIFTPTDAKDAKFRLIFETDGKTVRSFRAGRVPEVHWIEGCL
ncbi:MAG: hypothetical protein H7Y38_20890 [Armatimonadetes bacterium]|nr:hypothetical protein [Armatimonadota bacterium]